MFEEFKKKFNIQKEDIILPDINNFYVDKFEIKKVLNHLKTDCNYLFTRLDCIVGKDNTDCFELNYILNSDFYNSKCCISCHIEYKDALINSVCEIFPSANFDEREIYDLFGIKFVNHPNLKRILLPESFIGYPLRKDYSMKDERLEWNND